ncbi:2OG-Fe(II) oxygenase superfamily protein [compost metagenome]
MQGKARVGRCLHVNGPGAAGQGETTTDPIDGGTSQEKQSGLCQGGEVATKRTLSTRCESILDYQAVMDAIYTRGWVIVDDFLTASEVDALRACLPGEWQPAGIGREGLHQGNPAIRRDQIHWLDPSLGAPVADYLARMESLRLAANRNLMLGLFDYEAHFARYRRGDFYATHRDAFAGRSNRRLTSVFYLNNGWQPQAGGVLRVYDNDEQFLMDVSPKGGRLVLFLSEEFPHEVLPASEERYSIAGWFRVNGNGAGRVDPPR